MNNLFNKNPVMKALSQDEPNNWFDLWRGLTKETVMGWSLTTHDANEHGYFPRLEDLRDIIYEELDE